MDDRLYQEAVRRREQLQKLLDDLSTELRAVEGIIRLYRGPQGQHSVEAHSESSDAGHQESSTQTAGSRHRNPLSPRQLADIAREEIVATGRPMTRGELVKALESRNVVLVARDKAKNLGTILWRFRDEFENIPGRGYWPKDVPLDGRLL